MAISCNQRAMSSSVKNCTIHELTRHILLTIAYTKVIVEINQSNKFVRLTVKILVIIGTSAMLMLLVSTVALMASIHHKMTFHISTKVLIVNHLVFYLLCN